MSVHDLLNSLNEFGEVIKCETCRAFITFLEYRSTNVRFCLLHDFKISYKSQFWRESVKILPSFTQRYNGRHNVSRKSVNH